MSDTSGESEEDSSGNTVLIQDPQCGTYFLKRRGVAAKIDGETVYFCSEACRDAYLRDRRGS